MKNWTGRAGATIETAFLNLLLSHHPREIEAGGGFAHFGVGDFLGLSQRMIGGGENHVLEQLRIRGVDRLWINFDGTEAAVAFCRDLDRAAAAGGFDRARGELRLNLLHLLLHSRSLLHEFSNA